MKQFVSSHFKGNCTIDDDFEPFLIKMNGIAQKYNITVRVNSSYRVDTHVAGAIVTPATHSNHMIDYAIDCNLEFNGILYNSVKMQADTGVVKQFINEVKATGLRWEDDFGKPDPVQFDDGLNIKNVPLWTAKYNELHGVKA